MNCVWSFIKYSLLENFRGRAFLHRLSGHKSWLRIIIFIIRIHENWMRLSTMHQVPYHYCLLFTENVCFLLITVSCLFRFAWIVDSCYYSFSVVRLNPWNIYSTSLAPPNIGALPFFLPCSFLTLQQNLLFGFRIKQFMIINIEFKRR